jgi:MOSC domain-containing protein YiiM
MPFKTWDLKMKLISVNVGLPREVTWKEKTVSTGIFKQPVSERVMVRSWGIRQSSLRLSVRALRLLAR